MILEVPGMALLVCVGAGGVHLADCSPPGDPLLAPALLPLRTVRTSNRLTTQPRRRMPWKQRAASQRAHCACGGKDQAGPRCLHRAPLGATQSLPPPTQRASVRVFHAFPEG